MRDMSKSEVFDVVIDVENAMTHTKQALAVMDMWMDSLGSKDDEESIRVSAIHTLVSEALLHLIKVTEKADA